MSIKFHSYGYKVDVENKKCLGINWTFSTKTASLLINSDSESVYSRHLIVNNKQNILFETLLFDVSDNVLFVI